MNKDDAAALKEGRRKVERKNGSVAADYSDVETISDFQDSDDDRCSTPESQKDTKCSVCARNVNSSDKSLQCDKCNEWCHIKVRDSFVIFIFVICISEICVITFLSTC